MEAVTDSLFFSFKITVDGDCSHEIRRQLLLGRKPMTLTKPSYPPESQFPQVQSGAGVRKQEFSYIKHHHWAALFYNPLTLNFYQNQILDQ